MQKLAVFQIRSWAVLSCAGTEVSNIDFLLRVIGTGRYAFEAIDETF